jgi:hypothetical protein
MACLRSSLRASTLSRPSVPRPRSRYTFGVIGRRLASTTTATNPATISLRTYIYATLFLSLGLGTGYVGSAIVRPPPFPDVGSEADIKHLSKLAADIDKLPIVKSLRGNATKHTKADAMPEGDAISVKTGDETVSGGGEDEAWIEIPVEYEESNTLVNDSMSGTRGLGVQRAFWSPVRKELVTIIWFGGGLSGWPGITHGGAIATVFTEAMRKAIQCTQLKDRNSGSLLLISKSTADILLTNVSRNLGFVRPLKSQLNIPIPDQGKRIIRTSRTTDRARAKANHPNLLRQRSDQETSQPNTWDHGSAEQKVSSGCHTH